MPDRLDYSKWDHIEDSEDECDDLPQQIDKKSFQRYTKNKRAERDTDERKREEKLKKRLEVVEDKLAQLGTAGRTHVAGQKLEKEKTEIVAQLETLEKQKHWNADNMCHVVEDRTIVTESPSKPSEPSKSGSSTGKPTAATAVEVERETLEGYAEFCEKHAHRAEELIAMSQRPITECEDFLISHADSVLSDHCETYMMLDCLEKEMNGQHKEMVASARQQQLVTQVREMARTLNRPPQDAVKLIFERFEREGIETSFKEQVDVYIAKVVERAKVKRKEMDDERNSDEEMDPEVQKVLDELPPAMVEAFRAQDLRALHLAVAALPPEKGKYYLSRCEEVGLWNSGG